jgi:ribose transport system permease protein
VTVVERREASPDASRQAWYLRAYRGTKSFRPVLVLVVLLVAVLSVLQPAFLTVGNLTNLVNGVAILWIVSMGMTFVVLSGGIDLSLAALATLSGVSLGFLVTSGIPALIAIPSVVVGGAVLAAVVNGLPIGLLRMSFFVVTLATGLAITGFINLLTSGRTQPITDGTVISLAIGRPLGVPNSILIMAVIFAAALFVQRSTYFGRDVYAVGGSYGASRLSGINVPWVIVGVYAISGMCAALGGVLQVGRVGAATALVDMSLPLQAAAAVLLGGTALVGGAGGVGGTALGVIFIGVLQNGLSISGVPSFWQQVVTGVILFWAVLGDRFRVSEWLRSRADQRSRLRATAPPA